MFPQIFITVPGVITGTFSGISQHPSKALIIIFSFYSAHEVVVEKIEIASICLTSSLPDNILCYNEAMANGDRYYIAARFERDKEQVPRKFVVGDGEIYGGYMNAPLEPSCKTVYKVYVRAATEQQLSCCIWGNFTDTAEVCRRTSKIPPFFITNFKNLWHNCQ